MTNNEIDKRIEKHCKYVVIGTAVTVAIVALGFSILSQPSDGFLALLISVGLYPLVVGCLAGDRPWSVSVEDWNRYEESES
jgi:hypothetical protein